VISYRQSRNTKPKKFNPDPRRKAMDAKQPQYVVAVRLLAHRSVTVHLNIAAF